MQGIAGASLALPRHVKVLSEYTRASKDVKVLDMAVRRLENAAKSQDTDDAVQKLSEVCISFRSISFPVYFQLMQFS